MKIPKQEKEKQSFIEFLGCVKSIFKEKGRWLYAIFAIGCFIMFILFGVLFYLSETPEKQYGIKGVYKAAQCVLLVFAAGPPVYAYIMSIGDHLVNNVSAGGTLLAVFVVLFFIKPTKEEKPA